MKVTKYTPQLKSCSSKFYSHHSSINLPFAPSPPLLLLDIATEGVPISNIPAPPPPAPILVLDGALPYALPPVEPPLPPLLIELDLPESAPLPPLAPCALVIPSPPFKPLMQQLVVTEFEQRLLMKFLSD